MRYNIRIRYQRCLSLLLILLISLFFFPDASASSIADTNITSPNLPYSITKGPIEEESHAKFNYTIKNDYGAEIGKIEVYIDAIFSEIEHSAYMVNISYTSTLPESIYYIETDRNKDTAHLYVRKGEGVLIKHYIFRIMPNGRIFDFEGTGE